MTRAESGLALHAQSLSGKERNVLIDFGFTPEVLNNNIAVIGIDRRRSMQWSSIMDTTIISGTVGFFEKHGRALKKDIPFYVGGRLLHTPRGPVRRA